MYHDANKRQDLDEDKLFNGVTWYSYIYLNFHRIKLSQSHLYHWMLLCYERSLFVFKKHSIYHITWSHTENIARDCSDEILLELASHAVLLITYPPHSSHIFQVRDVLLFAKLIGVRILFRSDPIKWIKIKFRVLPTRRMIMVIIWTILISGIILITFARSSDENDNRNQNSKNRHGQRDF
jgi:hypothetical protein